jgi:hypothetical protein
MEARLGKKKRRNKAVLIQEEKSVILNEAAFRWSERSRA